MSRRHTAEKRIVLPDAKFGDKVVAKFINNVMEHGKKAVAEKIVYSAFDMIAAKSKQDALKVFADALENVKPLVEVKSALVVLLTKCRWKFVLIVVRLWLFVGLLMLLKNVQKPL